MAPDRDEELAAITTDADRELFARALQLFRTPPRPQPATILMTLLAVVFVAGAFVNLRSIAGVVTLVVVLLVHEAGHALGMRAFGYANVQMFFIPFFGAAVTGRPRGAAAWKEAVVLLLGPAPGIVLGLSLMIASSYTPRPSAVVFVAAGTALWLNAFNLLPLGFLDGGQFLRRTLFSRHRVLDVGFQAASTLLLLGLALLGHMYVVAAFAAMGLLALPPRWRMLHAAARVRRALPQLPTDPAAITEADAATLFVAVRGALRYPSGENAATVASGMETALDLVRRPPGIVATIALTFAYAFTLVFAVWGVALHYTATAPAKWVPVRAARWSAEFPRDPGPPQFYGHEPHDASAGARQVVIGVTQRFSLTVQAGADDPAWVLAQVDQLAKQAHMRLDAMSADSVGAVHGRAAVFSMPGRVLHARFFAARGYRYLITASAPEWGRDQERFLRSFALRDSATAP